MPSAGGQNIIDFLSRQANSKFNLSTKTDPAGRSSVLSDTRRALVTAIQPIPLIFWPGTRFSVLPVEIGIILMIILIEHTFLRGGEATIT